MSGGPASRGLFMNFFRIVKKSFAVAKESNGKFMGSDPYGNKYYEIPADPR